MSQLPWSNRMHPLLAALLIVRFLLPNSLTAVADWPQFRGVNSAGIAEGPAVPVEFGPGKHELWSIKLDSGHSSPCVVGNSIFLTTFTRDDKTLKVVCLNRGTGSLSWQRVVPTEKIETGHPSFNPASSTPASDGSRVVAYFGSYGLICFDLSGKQLWDMKMPVAKSYAGNATSPAIYGDRVILYRGNFVDHYLLCVDIRTGKTVWKVPQDEPFAAELACTSCPILWHDQLIVHSARSLQAVDISSGKQQWAVKCATTATSTPVIAANEVIVAAWNKMGEPSLRPPFPAFNALLENHDRDGDSHISQDEFPRMMIFHRPDGAEAPQNGAAVRFKNADRDGDGEITPAEWQATVVNLEKFRAGYDKHGMLAVDLDSRGMVDAEQVRTLDTDGIPEVPSPLFHDGYLYFVKNGGVLSCVDVATGRRVSRVRTRGMGTHYASPIIADGKLYCTAGEGKITVLSLGPEPKILAVNDLHEPVFATPAAADGVLYVRTHSKLSAFGASDP